MGKALAQELQDLGLEGAHLAENRGGVRLAPPATPGREEVPVLALIAHMDTTPRVPSENVQARVVRYEGGDLVLNQEKGIVTTLKEFPDLAGQVGKDLVVTDGTTLLGGGRQGRGWRRSSPPWNTSWPTRSGPTAGWPSALPPTRRWAPGQTMWTWTSWGRTLATPWTAAPWEGWSTRTSMPQRWTSSSTGVNIHPGRGRTNCATPA